MTNERLGVTDEAYLDCALVHAEQLLAFAAEAGINVDATDRAAVLEARASRGDVWTPDRASTLLSAYTRVAAALKPVTAETLKGRRVRNRSQ